MSSHVCFEVIERGNEDYSFNIVFLDTGRICQKRRSKEWLMRRVFFYELRTWFKRGEIVSYIKEVKKRGVKSVFISMVG